MITTRSDVKMLLDVGKGKVCLSLCQHWNDNFEIVRVQDLELCGNMRPAYVCANCRRQLFNRSWRSRNIRWSHAWPASQLDSLPIDNARGERSPKSSLLNKPVNRRRDESYQRQKIAKEYEGQDKALEELFVQSDKKDLVGNHIPRERSIPPGSVSGSVNTRLKLEQLVGEGSDEALAQCWQILGEMDSNTGGLSSKDALLMSRRGTVTDLIQRSFDIWLSTTGNNKVPAAALAVQKLARQGLLRESDWIEALKSLLLVAAKQESASVDLAYSRSALDEALKIWSLFFQQYSRKRNLDKPTEFVSDDWRALPDDKALGRVRTKFLRAFNVRLLHFLPQVETARYGHELSALALVTWQMSIQGESSSQKDKASTSAPFQSFISHLIPYSDIQKTTLGKLNDWNFPTSFVEQLQKEIRISTSEALSRLVPEDGSLDDPIFESQGKSRPSALALQFSKRLARALEKKDLQRTSSLWSDANKMLNGRRTSKDGDKKGKVISFPSALYDHFIMAFMALRASNKAIEVWNRMIEAEAGPTQGTWHAMLIGCSKARDINALADVWSKMAQSSVEPDVESWTTRIHTLASSRHPEAGVEALQEMAQAWINAVEKQKRPRSSQSQADLVDAGDIGGKVKPRTASVNAAMAGFLHYNRYEDARKIQEWALGLGIKPDVATYNMLIKSKVRQDDIQSALKYIYEMETSGITPDIITYTTILSAHIQQSLSSNSTDEEVERLVRDTLEKMKSVGVQANVYSYGTIIDTLLRDHANLHAADAVLKHMQASHLRPSAHIYTMILQYHFKQESPDAAAIEELWQKVRADGGAVDDYFYDHMIGGYARLGNIGKMMAFLRRAFAEGKKPAWQTLSTIARTLSETHEYSQLSEVVQAAEQSETLVRESTFDRRTKKAFWDLVDILRRRGIRL